MSEGHRVGLRVFIYLTCLCAYCWIVSPSAGASWPWLPWPRTARMHPRQNKVGASFMVVGEKVGSEDASAASVAKSSHTISSCEGNIHPSLDARDPRNSSLFSSPCVLLAAQVTLFVWVSQDNRFRVLQNLDPVWLDHLSAPIDSQFRK